MTCYCRPEKVNHESVPVIGKTIISCCKSEDDKGYDVLRIGFSDGSALLVREEGQSGYFVLHCEAPLA